MRCVETHLAHEGEPLRDLRHDVLGDLLFLGGKLQLPEEAERAADRESGEFIDRPRLQADVPRDLVEPRAVAARARLRLALVERFVLPLLREFDLDRRLEFRIDRPAPHLAEAVAFLAPAVRRVERKQPRIELLE